MGQRSIQFENSCKGVSSFNILYGKCYLWSRFNDTVVSKWNICYRRFQNAIIIKPVPTYQNRIKTGICRMNKKDYTGKQYVVLYECLSSGYHQGCQYWVRSENPKQWNDRLHRAHTEEGEQIGDIFPRADGSLPNGFIFRIRAQKSK